MILDYYLFKISRMCLPASFTQYTVTITQAMELVSYQPGVKDF